MVSSAWQGRIVSPRLLRELRDGSRDDFALAHPSTHFLAIALTMGADDTELLEGLSLMSQETKVERPMKALPFKTKAQRSVEGVAPRAAGSSPFDWAERDSRVVEVGKRGDLSSAYPNRISIGRA